MSTTKPQPRPASPRSAAAPKRRRTARLLPYLFIGPAIAYLAVFLVYPLLQGFQLSFTDTLLVNPSEGDNVGLANFTELLGSRVFWNSLLATLIYTLGTVVGALVLGTAAALAINRPFRGRLFARSILTLPWAMPTVAAALVFTWIYNQQSGILNETTGALGLGEHGWLTDPAFGMPAVLATTIWKVFPLVMLVMLAALQSVPDELYEATRVDGADALSTFRAVVLPHLMPTVRVVALLMTIWSIRRFEIIFLLTGGGPVETTNTLVINIYRRAFSDLELGSAAAIGMLGLVLSLGVTALFFLAERREARKEGAA